MAAIGQLLSSRQSRIVLGVLGAVVVLAALVAVGTESSRVLLIAVALTVLAVSFQLWLRVDPAVIVTTGLVLSVFSGRWSYLGLPFGIDRLIVLAGVAALAVRLRRNPPTTAPAPTRLYWLLAVALTYALLSALFAGTFFDTISFFELVDAFGLVPFTLFATAPFIFDTPERRNMLLGALVALGGYLGLTALFEGLRLTALVFPKYILITSPTSNYGGRAIGPFLEPGANGGAMIVCAVAAGMAVVGWQRRSARLAAGAVLALCLAGIVFTLTRQVWLGALVGAAGAFVVVPELRRYALPSGVAAVLGVFALIAFVPGLRSSADTRFGEQSPLWDRKNSNIAGVNMVLARPLFGFGWGTFHKDSEPYYKLPFHPVTSVGHIHSVFLSNLATLGFVGTAMWFVALVWAFWGAVQRRGPPEFERWRAGFVTVAISWLVIANFTPLTYGFSNYMVWFWAGLLYVGSVPPRTPVTAGRRRTEEPALA